MIPTAALLLTAVLAQPVTPPAEATGIVFHDLDADGRRAEAEPGIPGVCVSNGREVVRTDDQGRYTLPVTDDTILFVIKPRGWQTRRDERNIPRFYYVHKPHGSPPNLKFPGVEPTGPLPASVDFALTKVDEPDRFTFIAIGDPQPRNITEVDYFSHDIVEELIGAQQRAAAEGDAAAFITGLGDIAFDDLTVYEPLTQALGYVGVPVYYVHGNHDVNYDVESDDLSDETWERTFGPATYAYNVGPVHFIVIDNIGYQGQSNKRRYTGRIGPANLAFIAADLEHVPVETPIVLLMHIPLTGTVDRDALFDLIDDRPHTLSLSAHRHEQEHLHLDHDHGWHGHEPHHHVIAATGSGSWWSGTPDEEGIPHATMADGAPNGYTIVTFDGPTYAMRFKAARRPADHQMTIFAPDEIAAADLASTEILVNVFAGSPRSTVEMRIRTAEERTPADSAGDWTTLTLEPRPDPHQQRMKQLEKKQDLPGRDLPKQTNSPHIWVATFPPDLPPGTHLIEIRTTDQFGQTYHGRRLFRVR